ncbi:MAG: 2-oxoacid:acceptor oxidoreductase family protein [Spirochaetaceae bacterium]|nr:2-oxoacid:acceptor oxidoreductase family protein [Spirochaetaceae bacterium]MBO4727606.1 2-oxoacid:acceptor oxidoreductase family protein [Spirochaetaceae bacterium]
MTTEIIFAGFGGQGVILAGKILALAGMSEDKYVSHIPSYGAEMRGGTANCSVIVSDDEVASPVIEKPDVVVALNKPSMTKFEPMIKAGGLLIYNSSLIDSKPSRKDIKSIALPANEIAEKCNNARGANMVVLGCLAKVIPGMVSGVKPFEYALDEAISARNKKFNPINIATIETAYKMDYEIK